MIQLVLEQVVCVRTNNDHEPKPLRGFCVSRNPFWRIRQLDGFDISFFAAAQRGQNPGPKFGVGHEVDDWVEDSRGLGEQGWYEGQKRWDRQGGGEDGPQAEDSVRGPGYDEGQDEDK